MTIQIQSSSSPVLRLSTKLFYGVGHMALALPSTLQSIFQLFFLTNIAGLNPSLAGLVLLIGKGWDACNDPLVGWLSDRTRSRWGKRYPWIMVGAVPLGIFFFLQWIVPQFGDGSNQTLLFWYYVIVSLLYDTASTMVTLPYLALAPELAQDYNDRTSLISFQSAFTSGAAMVTLILAQIVFVTVADLPSRYLVLGGICAMLAVLTIYLGAWGIYQQVSRSSAVSPSPSSITGGLQLRSLLRNRPFLCVLGIFLCFQLAIQMTGAILPYFIVNWMGMTDQVIAQVAISGTAMILVMLLIWNRVRQRLDKRAMFLLAFPFWLAARLCIAFVQPGQIGWLIGLVLVSAIGISACLLVPFAMLPDVIDFDELQNGQRREGLFYGVITLLQKLSLAIALFLVGKSLDWAGFIPAIAGQPLPLQPDTALLMIRWIYGPIPALIGLGSLILAYFYPLTRQIHADILLRLALQRQPIVPESSQPHSHPS
jgi:glycoside/pentoside/hexuronide:cation symporter, GPH family